MEVFFLARSTKSFRFAIVSDTHFGAANSRIDALQDFYKQAYQRGIKTFLHAGDLTEGVRIYKNQVHEVLDNTMEKQAKRVIQEYPKVPGGTTYLILGNHDIKDNPISWVMKGMNYLHKDGSVESFDGRDDFKLLGNMSARMKLPGDIGTHLVHPHGGGAYTRGYAAQKYIRNHHKEDLPDMLIMGHFHQADYLMPNGIPTFYAGCFKDIGDFEARFGFSGDGLGGWIVEYEWDKPGHVSRINPEFLRYESKGTWYKSKLNLKE